MSTLFVDSSTGLASGTTVQDVVRLGIVWTPSEDYYLDQLEVWISSASSGGGTIQGFLYAADVSGHPTGSILDSSDQVVANTATTWETLTFSGTYNTLSSTQYVIVVYRVAGAGYPNIGSSTAALAELYRTISTNSGFTWSALNPVDPAVKIWGTSSASPPSQASVPNPTDLAIDVSINLAELSWQGDGDTYDVYFGPIGNLSLVSSAQAGTTFDMSGQTPLDYQSEYEWRIDSTNANGTTTGEVWDFTTEVMPSPDKATDPVPADTATDISRFLSELAWTTGADTDTFDVYFGPQGNMALVSAGQVATSYDLSSHQPLDYGVTYEWRVDPENEVGPVTGDVWTFTVVAFSPPSGSNQSTTKRMVVAGNNSIYYSSG